jgi:hypothetical protein
MNDRPTYRRGALNCYLDRCRGYLVAATAEEAVRQDVLDWLIDEIGVPEGRLRSEFSQRRRGGEGRPDVIVLAPDADDTDGEVLMVVECKRPGTFLEDRTREQAIGYAEQLGANVIVVTNGDERRTYAMRESRWSRVEGVPTWDDMLDGRHGGWVEDEKFTRWAWEQIRSVPDACCIVEDPKFEWIVGKDSPDELVPFALNLFGLLADEHEGPAVPFRSGDIVVEQDLGQRSRRFANSAGGVWSSDYYRSFLVYEDGRATYQVVSLAVIANAKVENHRLWGNRRGRTMLIAAIDDGPTSHVGLEMGLDEAFDPRARTRFVDLCHSGAMTTGKRGATKREVVLAELARHDAGDLVRQGRVVLGLLPLREEMTWPMAQEFVGNAIRYALVRDRIRADGKVGGRV